jgi:hypothetical protein
MNLLIDVHTVLSTPSDLDDWHDDPEHASEQLNIMLHQVADHCVNDDNAIRFEQLCQQIWEYWYKDRSLSEIDEDDLLDWVDQQLATWDDSDMSEITPEHTQD